jgi:hypothetical protein
MAKTIEAAGLYKHVSVCVCVRAHSRACVRVCIHTWECVLAAGLYRHARVCAEPLNQGSLNALPGSSRTVNR